MALDLTHTGFTDGTFQMYVTVLYLFWIILIYSLILRKKHVKCLKIRGS